MTVPRLRMVAGPNGSGKSTLFDLLSERGYRLGYCLNPDQLERRLAEARRLDFRDWGLEVEETALREFVKAHALGTRVAGASLVVRANSLELTKDVRGGYFTAVLCDFMRRRWLEEGETFTFETVMSNRDKVELLGEAVARGFRTYLYFVCTDSPLINRERVANRVLLGGHPVPPEKIEARYHRSLALLPEAVRLATRAYVFDNSGEEHRLIAEFESGRLMAAAEELPGWFVRTGLLTDAADS